MGAIGVGDLRSDSSSASHNRDGVAALIEVSVEPGTRGSAIEVDGGWSAGGSDLNQSVRNSHRRFENVGRIRLGVELAVAKIGINGNIELCAHVF